MHIRQKIHTLCFLILATSCGKSGTDPDVPLDAGQKLCEPVVLALKKYQEQVGRYPQSLTELTTSGLLREIPTIPPRSDTLSVSPLEYEVCTDGSFYYLHFSYDVPSSVFADWYRRYYISYDEKWATRRYPPHFEDLAAKHFGELWRASPTDENLKATVDHLIQGAIRDTNCVQLFRVLVTDSLGSGTLVAVPMGIDSDTK